MNEGKISIRYTRALFNLAKDENLQEMVKNDMEAMLDLFSSVAEFKLLIDNPVLKPSEKIKILKELFDNKLQKITVGFLELIVQNNRLNYLKSMALVYIDLYKKDRGIQSALLTTPVPVDEGIRISMLKTIQRKLNIKIELNEKVNESLIGGFVLRIGNQQIDASVSNQLEIIKKELINNN